MPKVYELIDHANILISNRQFNRAGKLIEEALRLDPNNLEVWESYLRNLTTRDGLEYARDRVLTTIELNRPDEFGFFTGRDYLIRRIDSKLRNFSSKQ